jgi:hypothetical protein
MCHREVDLKKSFTLITKIKLGKLQVNRKKKSVNYDEKTLLYIIVGFYFLSGFCTGE